MMGLARRGSEESQEMTYVPSDWWHGLLGTDGSQALDPRLQSLADRMLATRAVNLFYRPDLTQVGRYGGYGKEGNAAFDKFMDWLAPVGGEPGDPLTRFVRRHALIDALNHYPSGTRPALVYDTARFFHAEYRDERADPPVERRPFHGRARRKDSERIGVIG